MIIGLDDPEEIGTVIHGVYYLTPTHKVPASFLILREATYEEWTRYRMEVGRLYRFPREESGHYYLVTTD